MPIKKITIKNKLTLPVNAIVKITIRKATISNNARHLKITANGNKPNSIASKRNSSLH